MNDTTGLNSWKRFDWCFIYLLWFYFFWFYFIEFYLTSASALFVSGTASIGSDAVLVKFVNELRVKIIGVGQGEAFPRHWNDDDPGQRTKMTRSLFDQTEHFLLERRPPYDLQQCNDDYVLLQLMLEILMVRWVLVQKRNERRIVARISNPIA